ncbi:MAG: hypothetical protein ACJARR_003468 [Pseudophaeobacter arcticus]|jgi:hypothetical protein
MQDIKTVTPGVVRRTGCSGTLKAVIFAEMVSGGAPDLRSFACQKPGT